MKRERCTDKPKTTWNDPMERVSDEAKTNSMNIHAKTWTVHDDDRTKYIK